MKEGADGQVMLPYSKGAGEEFTVGMRGLPNNLQNLLVEAELWWKTTAATCVLEFLPLPSDVQDVSF